MTVVSIQPTYHCNLRCSYCFLGKWRNKSEILDLNILEQKLQEIKNYVNIDAIDLYGGEISILDPQYLRNLFRLCLEYCQDVNVTSNLANIQIFNILKEFPSIKLAVSLNWERKDFSRIKELLDSKQYKIDNILTVALPHLLQTDIKETLDLYQKWNLPVSIFRYKPSFLNSKFSIKVKEYEDFIIKFIKQYLNDKYTFPLNNLLELKNGKNIPLLSSSIFITPEGKYCWIDHFRNKEMYLCSDEITGWLSSAQVDYLNYRHRCKDCPYFGFCLAEHLDFEEINEDYCCGLKNLLNWWYKEGIYLK